MKSAEERAGRPSTSLRASSQDEAALGNPERIPSAGLKWLAATIWMDEDDFFVVRDFADSADH